MVLRRGARLSGQPVTREEWAAVMKLPERHDMENT